MNNGIFSILCFLCIFICKKFNFLCFYIKLYEYDINCIGCICDDLIYL